MSCRLIRLIDQATATDHSGQIDQATATDHSRHYTDCPLYTFECDCSQRYVREVADAFGVDFDRAWDILMEGRTEILDRHAGEPSELGVDA